MNFLSHHIPHKHEINEYYQNKNVKELNVQMNKYDDIKQVSGIRKKIKITSKEKRLLTHHRT